MVSGMLAIIFPTFEYYPINNGDDYTVGNTAVIVVYLPGHTIGSPS